jgi:hypothetical protein
MGLDIFVGTLTRYYSGQWETVVQQAFADDDDIGVLVVRPSSPDAETDPEAIRPAVLEWRRQLSDAFGAHLQEPLDWNESPEAPYFTDKPGRRCFNALVSWAEQHSGRTSTAFRHLCGPVDSVMRTRLVPYRVSPLRRSSWTDSSGPRPSTTTRRPRANGSCGGSQSYRCFIEKERFNESDYST